MKPLSKKSAKKASSSVSSKKGVKPDTRQADRPSSSNVLKKIETIHPLIEWASSSKSNISHLKTEFVILNSENLSKSMPLTWSGLAPSLWSPEFQSRWSKWIKETGTVTQSASVTFHFPAGQQVHVLVIHPDAFPLDKTHFLHRVLRDSFANAMCTLIDRPETDPLRVGRVALASLPHELQQRCLHALTFLAQTCTWKPISFQRSTSSLKLRKSLKTTFEVDLSLTTPTFQKLTQEAQALGRANTLTRTLADLPASLLNPLQYRNIALALAKNAKLKSRFLSTRNLSRLGAEAFLSVTRAESLKECEAGILQITYRPSGKKVQKRLALVGKGICFDTGGYNIKTGGGMHGMHGDMTGSALALAMVLYFAEINAPFEVSAHLAIAENLISPTAFKPNEIVTACDGTTIEVVDTDAEGRMILSDTLALVRREAPSLVIDYATLTGAAIRALDTRIGAVFSNKESLAEASVRCGKKSGERTWSFPLESDYREGLKSEIADLLQCATHNKSDHIYAATFLAHFIGDETPWIHLDLTPAKNAGGLGLVSTATTGFGTLWTQEVVKELLGR